MGRVLDALTIMLYWALVFLIIAIIAALFGSGIIASAAAGIAKVLFFIFGVVFVITIQVLQQETESANVMPVSG